MNIIEMKQNKKMFSFIIYSLIKHNKIDNCLFKNNLKLEWKTIQFFSYGVKILNSVMSLKQPILFFSCLVNICVVNTYNESMNSTLNEI